MLDYLAVQHSYLMGIGIFRIVCDDAADLQYLRLPLSMRFMSTVPSCEMLTPASHRSSRRQTKRRRKHHHFWQRLDETSLHQDSTQNMHK